MHTVVETPSYLAAAKRAGMSDAVRMHVVTVIAENPELGDLMVGAGGLRKFRFARPGTGKSGGYRILSYYVAEDWPVFLVGVFAKGAKANLTAAEKNTVAARLKSMAAAYRKTKR